MSTTIGVKALEKIVGQAILRVPGTLTRASNLDKITGRAYPRYQVELTKTESGTQVLVDATIAVAWPAPITDIAVAVRTSVRTHLQVLAGISEATVNVAVGPVIPEPERVTVEEVHTARLTPTPRRIYTVQPQPRPIPAPVPLATVPVRLPEPVAVATVRPPVPVPAIHPVIRPGSAWEVLAHERP